MLPSRPSIDLLNAPSELWVMFNSPAVTAADPHGKLDFFFFFVRMVLVEGKEREQDTHRAALQRKLCHILFTGFSISH